MLTSRYIDPTTDYGFKRLFGQEDSKDILKRFLYDILALPHPITDLTYMPTEQIPAVAGDRLGIYDVYCTDSAGQRFIVEMQRNRQSYYKERALYYATFPIVQQVEKGEKGPPFHLMPIYCISVLNFTIDDRDAYIRRVQLADMQTGEAFYDRLTFIFIILPRFVKTLDELTTWEDKWLYLLRHMPELDTIPESLSESPFSQAFRIAEQSALSSEEWMYYQGSLKRSRDELSWLYTGLEEGREEGRQEGLQEGRQEGLQEGRQEKAREIARALLAQGLDRARVAEIVGIPEDTL